MSGNLCCWNLINIIRESNDTLNNDNLGTIETNLLEYVAVPATIENEELEETDDAQRKFYQLLYLNEDLQKK